MAEREPTSAESTVLTQPDRTNLSSELERPGDTPPFPSEGQRGVGACLLDLS